MSTVLGFGVSRHRRRTVTHRTLRRAARLRLRGEERSTSRIMKRIPLTCQGSTIGCGMAHTARRHLDGRVKGGCHDTQTHQDWTSRSGSAVAAMGLAVDAASSSRRRGRRAQAGPLSRCSHFLCYSIARVAGARRLPAIQLINAIQPNAVRTDVRRVDGALQPGEQVGAADRGGALGPVRVAEPARAPPVLGDPLRSSRRSRCRSRTSSATGIIHDRRHADRPCACRHGRTRRAVGTVQRRAAAQGSTTSPAIR